MPINSPSRVEYRFSRRSLCAGRSLSRCSRISSAVACTFSQPSGGCSISDESGSTVLSRSCTVPSKRAKRSSLVVNSAATVCSPLCQLTSLSEGGVIASSRPRISCTAGSAIRSVCPARFTTLSALASGSMNRTTTSVVPAGVVQIVEGHPHRIGKRRAVRHVHRQRARGDIAFMQIVLLRQRKRRILQQLLPRQQPHVLVHEQFADLQRDLKTLRGIDQHAHAARRRPPHFHVHRFFQTLPAQRLRRRHRLRRRQVAFVQRLFVVAIRQPRHRRTLHGIGQVACHAHRHRARVHARAAEAAVERHGDHHGKRIRRHIHHHAVLRRQRRVHARRASPPRAVPRPSESSAGASAVRSRARSRPASASRPRAPAPVPACTKRTAPSRANSCRCPNPPPAARNRYPPDPTIQRCARRAALPSPCPTIPPPEFPAARSR